MPDVKLPHQLLTYAVIGASGVIVNMGIMVFLTLIGPGVNDTLTGFGLRWYHAYSTAAFLGANGWNFYLNRRFTFRSHASWERQYASFLAVGVFAQIIGLGILTLLMSPSSAVSLPEHFFDGSSPLRTKVYAAQLLTIAVVTPLSFGFNKIWTFRRGT